MHCSTSSAFLHTMSTILQLMKADVSLGSMMRAIKASGLEETLNGNGPFTILAPVNLAFSQMKSANFDELLKPENSERLSEMLSFHILPEKKIHSNFINGQKLKTLSGVELIVSLKDGDVFINGAKIMSRDRQGSNGVVHAINAVNIPTIIPV